MIFTLNASTIEEVTLSKGQVHEITGKRINNYIIGNKDIIGVKYLKSTTKLHIKAKMTGFSELTLFKNSGKEVIKIYVLAKNQHLKLLETSENLTQIPGLKKEIRASTLFISGEISEHADYIALKTIIQNKKHINASNLKLADTLKKNITSSLYKDFFNNYLDDIKCTFKNIDLRCQTTDEILSQKDFIKNIQRTYYATFESAPYLWDRENLEIEMRIFQIERLDGQEIDFGLGDLSIELGSLIKGSFGIFRSNMTSFKNINYSISTLSKPKALLSLNTPLVISIGSDIPFQTNSTNLGPGQISWRFAGLKVNVTVTKVGNKYLINYNNEISRPVSVNTTDQLRISGSKQQSSIKVSLDESVSLFEVNLKTHDNNNSSVPIIDQIPILKNIFSSKTSSSTHKKVIAIAKLTKR